MHRIITVLIILLSLSVRANTAVSPSMANAIVYGDVKTIILMSITSPEDETAALDALSTTIDLSIFTYEQLAEWSDLQSSDKVSALINQELSRKEIEIYSELKEISSENLTTYLSHFPKRSPLIKKYLSSVVVENVDSLTYREIVYLIDNRFPIGDDIFEKALKNRLNEKKDILKETAPQYLQNEKTLSERTKYNIETKLWAYYVSAQKQINEAYSKIGLVPDNPYDAANQYQRIVNAVYSPVTIHDIIQTEVNNYCNQINNARREHFSMAGKSKYPTIKYNVPQISLKSEVPVDPLWQVYDARQRFAQNREDVSNGSGIVSWIFGPVGGLIVKGLGDWMAVEGLVDSEYNARKEYVQSVQNQLYSTFNEFSNRVLSGFDDAIDASQKNYSSKISE